MTWIIENPDVSKMAKAWDISPQEWEQRYHEAYKRQSMFMLDCLGVDCKPIRAYFDHPGWYVNMQAAMQILYLGISHD